MRHPYTLPFEELNYKTCVHELTEGVHNVPYTVECRKLIHADPCYGYRFEIDGKAVAYCTDTGYCENAVKLARGADLLIAECSLKKGQKNARLASSEPRRCAEDRWGGGRKETRPHAFRRGVIHNHR